MTVDIKAHKASSSISKMKIILLKGFVLDPKP